jgi:hypothetical protein
MAKEFTVLSVIICEDIREEARGKVSANGIFDDELIVASLPAAIPKLAFRIAIEAHAPRPKTVHIAVVGDKGTSLVDTNAQSVPPPPGSSSKNPKLAIQFAIVGAVFSLEETFKIMLGFGGKDRQVGKFVVRLPKNQDERNRVA